MFAEKDILRLTVSERFQLAQDIWDSIAQVPECVDFTDEEKLEIDRRLDAYHKTPDAGSPWSLVRDRIENRR